MDNTICTILLLFSSYLLVEGDNLWVTEVGQTFSFTKMGENDSGTAFPLTTTITFPSVNVTAPNQTFPVTVDTFDITLLLLESSPTILEIPDRVVYCTFHNGYTNIMVPGGTVTATNDPANLTLQVESFTVEASLPQLALGDYLLISEGYTVPVTFSNLGTTFYLTEFTSDYPVPTVVVGVEVPEPLDPKWLQCDATTNVPFPPVDSTQSVPEHEVTVGLAGVNNTVTFTDRQETVFFDFSGPYPALDFPHETQFALPLQTVAVPIHDFQPKLVPCLSSSIICLQEGEDCDTTTCDKYNYTCPSPCRFAPKLNGLFICVCVCSLL